MLFRSLLIPGCAVPGFVAACVAARLVLSDWNDRAGELAIPVFAANDGWGLLTLVGILSMCAAALAFTNGRAHIEIMASYQDRYALSRWALYGSYAAMLLQVLLAAYLAAFVFSGLSYIEMHAAVRTYPGKAVQFSVVIAPAVLLPLLFLPAARASAYDIAFWIMLATVAWLLPFRSVLFMYLYVWLVVRLPVLRGMAAPALLLLVAAIVALSVTREPSLLAYVRDQGLWGFGDVMVWSLLGVGIFADSFLFALANGIETLRFSLMSGESEDFVFSVSPDFYAQGGGLGSFLPTELILSFGSVGGLLVLMLVYFAIGRAFRGKGLVALVLSLTFCASALALLRNPLESSSKVWLYFGLGAALYASVAIRKRSGGERK